MNIQRAQLKIGTILWYEGERHQVTALNGLAIQLRSMSSGVPMLLAASELLSSNKYSLLDDGLSERASDTSPGEVIPGSVPDEVTRAARLIEGHLLEVLTGYKSGSCADAAPGEPKAQYDPSLTKLSARIEAKATELGRTSRSLWKLHTAYRKHGQTGLIDRRAVRLSASGAPTWAVRAIDRIVLDLLNQSNQTKTRIVELVKKQIRQLPDLPADFKMPSSSTLGRWIFAREDAKRLVKSAASRRNAANRPGKTYTRFHATRPGEVVLIDSTPLDAFALDPITHQVVSVDLTIAIDLFTRSLVGWRFTHSTKAVDAAFLLADIISPKRAREFFGDAIEKPFVGIPELIVTRGSELSDGHEEVLGRVLAVPFLHPESVVIDQGRVYLSDAFRYAAQQLGINILLARPYSPTDKAHVERMFRSIREQFVMALPGYTGPNVYERGSNPEGDAHFYLHEIDDRFASWVAVHWQNRTHDGLFLPVVPTLELTPNQMLAEGIARAGCMFVLPDPDMHHQLLPVVWRQIHHYGVDVDKLRYDSPALDPFRNAPSPFQGKHPGKWPFRQDPRDKSKLLFHDVETGVWHEIPWTGASHQNRPFDDRTLVYAKQLAYERLQTVPSDAEVETELQSLLDSMFTVDEKSKKVRKLLGAAIRKSELAERDRLKAGGKAARKPPEPQAVASSLTQQKHPVDPIVAPELIEASELEDMDSDQVDSRASFMDGGHAVPSVKPVHEALEDDDDDLAY